MHEHPRDAIERPPIRWKVALSLAPKMWERGTPECSNHFHNILFERQHMIISGAEAARLAASTGKQLGGIMRTHLPAVGSMVFLSASVRGSPDSTNISTSNTTGMSRIPTEHFNTSV